MEDITTYIENDEKYIVLDNERNFIDITMPKKGQSIILKDQDGELYSITNITEEVPNSKEIQARIIKQFKRASSEERLSIIDAIKESIENDERRKSRT